jgi:hypothetical protein
MKTTQTTEGRRRKQPAGVEPDPKTMALDNLVDAAQAYYEAKVALEDAQAAVPEARQDLQDRLDEYAATGGTPEEADEALTEYNLTCDDINCAWCDE